MEKQVTYVSESMLRSLARRGGKHSRYPDCFPWEGYINRLAKRLKEADPEGRRAHQLAKMLRYEEGLDGE